MSVTQLDIKWPNPEQHPAKRVNDPDTCVEPSQARMSKGRLKALACHYLHPDGLTDFELAELIDSQQTSAGVRRKELERAGLAGDRVADHVAGCRLHGPPQRHGDDPMSHGYTHNDVDVLKDTLIGHSIVSVQLGGDLPEFGTYITAEGKVTLDDGTQLILAGNVGGCICGAGDYELTRLNDMPINGITNVEVAADGNGPYSDGFTYRIFVLAQDQRFELAAFDGADGSGYYGTGFWFTVLAGAA